MKLSDIPTKFAIPFANSATSPFIRTIPTTPSGTPGQASLQTGFPSENFSPVAAGGVPPFGADFNGLLNQSTSWNWWQATGAFPPYDQSWQMTNGGYPNTAVVSSLVIANRLYMSIVDNNTTNPDTGGAGWIVFFSILTTNTVFYVNGATGSDSFDGTSPTISGGHGPWATLQHAANVISLFNLNGFNITINVADFTTYGALSALPVSGAGQVFWVGNASTPGNCIVNGVNSSAITVAGTAHNFNGFKVQTSGTVVNDALNGIFAPPGSNVTVSNFEYGTCSGSHNRLINATMNLAGTSVRITGGSAGNALSFGAFLECDELSFGNFGGFSGGTLTWTLVGTPAFGTAFYCLSGLSSAIWGSTSVVTGSATGSKFNISQNSILTTGGQGQSALPGSTAGTISSGAQYT